MRIMLATEEIARGRGSSHTAQFGDTGKHSCDETFVVLGFGDFVGCLVLRRCCRSCYDFVGGRHLVDGWTSLSKKSSSFRAVGQARVDSRMLFIKNKMIKMVRAMHFNKSSCYTALSRKR